MEPDSILEKVVLCVGPLYERDMIKMATAEFDRDLLCAKMSGITRQMRQSVNDKNVHVFANMLIIIKMNRVPINALVNGNWLGIFHSELTWTEKMLISRVCHNRCIVHVTSSGMHKMSANAVFFQLQCQRSMHLCHKA